MALLIAPKNEEAALVALRRYGARLLEGEAHALGAALVGVASASEAFALLGLCAPGEVHGERPMTVADGAIEESGFEEAALAVIAPFVNAGSSIGAEAIFGRSYTGACDVRSWRWEFREGKVYRVWDGDIQTKAGIEIAPPT
jgi:hypothetical protein